MWCDIITGCHELFSAYVMTCSTVTSSNDGYNLHCCQNDVFVSFIQNLKTLLRQNDGTPASAELQPDRLVLLQRRRRSDVITRVNPTDRSSLWLRTVCVLQRSSSDYQQGAHVDLDSGGPRSWSSIFSRFFLDVPGQATRLSSINSFLSDTVVLVPLMWMRCCSSAAL